MIQYGIMPDEALYPSKIKKVSPTSIHLTWNDGHEADYSAITLRRKCPCATCTQESPKPSAPPDNVEVSKVMAMGNYAIGFHFSDGHTTGIYSYEYLRGCCPCPSCTKS